MYRILKKSLSAGVITEKAPRIEDLQCGSVGLEIKRHIDKRFSGSLAIRMLDAGSCNACELEVNALGNPYYDIERFGVHFVASPRHADVLLVSGPVSRHMQTALLRTWEAMPCPKFLVAMGNCGCDGGIFGESYASCGAVENVLPVDVKISGCPPKPVDLLRGILTALKG